MSAPFSIRPAHWVALALVAVPCWKVIEWYHGSRPQRVDAAAAAAGATLFHHEWTPHDSLTKGDGLGPVFNARSCVECHLQGGPGGGGPIEANVTVYGIVDGQTRGLPPAGVVHRQAVRPDLQETLAQVRAGLPATPSLALGAILDGGGTQVRGVQISQRNTPALFGDGLIDAISDDAIVAHQREHSAAARLVGLDSASDWKVRGRVARLVDGRIGRFGWKGEFATLGDFVQAACANELGLSNPGRPQATPLGRPGPQAEGVDLTGAQCDLMADFLRGLPRPVAVEPADSATRSAAAAGRVLFASIGCADCHSPTLGAVEGLYSDLLLHDMGVDLESAPGAYGAPPVPAPQFREDARPNSAEWRTPPLWGVADSAPYLHDGRTPTLEDAIARHGGEAGGVTGRYKALPPDDQQALVAFLKTLRAPSAAVIASP
jgi:CxxC motif-containing protein (DUF1111 family)